MSTNETCGPLYAKLHEAFQGGRSLKHVLSIIREPLSEIALGKVTTRAYHHPLGFDTLILENQGDYGVCLHWWPDRTLIGQPGHPLEDLHSHSFDILSMSLSGAIGNQLATIEPLGPAWLEGLTKVPSWMEGDGYVLFDAQSGPGGQDTLRKTNIAIRLSDVLEPSFYEPGQLYSMSTDQVHTSVVGEQLGASAVTLMLAHNDPYRFNYVLGNLFSPDGTPTATYSVQREIYPPEATALLAGQLATLLALDR